MKKSLVCVPTYNEKENILPLLEHLLSLKNELHILVIDDKSPDGTANLVRQHSSFMKRVFLLERNGKKGLGKAYLAGFYWALEKEYDYIIQCDADFSHNPDYILIFLDELEKGHPMVIGSRNIEGGGVKNWSPFRQFLSWFGSFYGRSILGLKIHDLTGGFNAYRRETLKSIHLNKVHSNGYVFQIELKYRVFQKGLVAKEIPIIFPDRVRGDSKMNFKIVLEAFWHVIYLRLFCKE